MRSSSSLLQWVLDLDCPFLELSFCRIFTVFSLTPLSLYLRSLFSALFLFFICCFLCIVLCSSSLSLNTFVSLFLHPFYEPCKVTSFFVPVHTQNKKDTHPKPTYQKETYVTHIYIYLKITIMISLFS